MPWYQDTVGTIWIWVKGVGKWLVLAAATLTLGAVAVDKILEEPPVQPPVIEERFDWQNYSELEDISKRTHETKDFAHPTDPSKRIKIGGLNLLHYDDGEGFKEIDVLPFPEGIEITAPAEKHFILDLPEWSRAEVSEDGEEVSVYDKSGQGIYMFKNPLVVEKGKNPYKVIKGGQKIRETKDYNELIASDESIEVSGDAILVDFEVEDNKLYFKLPGGLNYPLEAYDDTSTSTMAKDVYMHEQDPNSNKDGSYLYVHGRPAANEENRAIVHFTLPSGSGTISDVTLWLYIFNIDDNAGDLQIHDLTQTAWVEIEATWNVYSTGNSWAVAGGDYNATIIDSYNFTQIEWINEDVMGGSAANPLTLTWEDDVNLLLRCANETTNNGFIANSSEEAVLETRPYFEVTYSEAAERNRLINVIIQQ